MQEKDEMRESALSTIAKRLSREHPQHAPLVHLAISRLTRVINLERNPIEELAQFANKLAEGVINSGCARNADLMLARTKRMFKAIALSIPGETHSDRLVRIGEVNTAPLTVHRYATALAAGIEGLRDAHRPRDAEDGELFAALGLYLLSMGTSPLDLPIAYMEGTAGNLLPIFDGKKLNARLKDELQIDPTYGTLPAGCDTKKLSSQLKQDFLINAAECINYGARLLDLRNRAEWRAIFKKDMLPRLKTTSGVWVKGKAARARFCEEHPQFRDEPALQDQGGFDAYYSNVKREFDGRAVKPRKRTAP